MKIVLLSDTHTQHEKVTLPKGDMIIHGGDISGRGTLTEVLNFLQWFSRLDFKYKIFIAGNHDFIFEKLNMSHTMSDGVTYLQDSLVEAEGLKIYGSPYTPKFHDWTFMKKRGADIRKVWNLIPDKVDILVTHGAPFRILDQTETGFNAGCEELLKRVNEIKPKMHIFGHIHEAYGSKSIGDTWFINASILDQNYCIKNIPVVIEMD